MSGSTRQSTWSWRWQIKWYAILFAIAALLVFIPFIKNGKSFIWDTDGIEQHYIALQYYGMWLRDIAASVIHGSPAIPLWDFGIGYGSDILTTFTYYAIGDPLNLVSAIVPTQYTEILYDALIVVRMFLAGLFFMVLCKRLSVGRAGALGGALAYAFCSWAIFAGLRHSFFLNPMVYLPLLLVGAEKILAKESPVLFIVMMAIAALSNFYFSYMLAIMVAIYTLVRFFGTASYRSVKNFFVVLFKFVFFAVGGLAIAGVIFIPVVLAVLDSSRVSATVVCDLLYPPYYYQQLLRGFCTSSMSYWSLIGAAGPVILGLPALFSAKGGRQLKVLLVILTVFLLFPIFGSILNGFSYVSNRWSWAYALLLCFIFAYCWERIVRPSRKTLVAMVGFAIVYILLVFLFTDGLAGNVFASLFVAFIGLLAVVLVNAGGSRGQGDHAHAVENGKKRGFTQRFGSIHAAASAALVIAVVAGILVNSSFRYDVDKSESLDEFVDAGMAYELVTDNPLRNVEYYGDQDGTFYRMGLGTPGRRLSASPVTWNNATVLRGISSTGFYWSLSGSAISDYLMDMAIPSFISQSYLGLDHRTFLNELASVKFYVSRTRGMTKAFIPYGYKAIAKPAVLEQRLDALIEAYKAELGVDELDEYQMKSTKWLFDSYRIDENQQPLPFGYSYTAFLDEASFEAMNPAQRQEALMQAVLITEDDEDEVSSALAPARITSGVKEIPVELKPSTGIDMTAENDFTVDKEYLEDGTAVLHMDVDIPAGYEAYLYVEGLEATELSQHGLYQDDVANNTPKTYWNNLTKLERERIILEDREDEELLMSGFPLLLKIECGEKANAIQYRSDRNPWSTGQTTYMANLGYEDEKRSGIDMTFEAPGRYSFDKMCVLIQPMDRYGDWVDDLSACTLQDVEFGTNEISGSIETDEARVLLLSMPYSTGWSATIDGEPVKLMRANDMFSGLLVTPGKHQVELHYVTPGLKYGLAATAAGLIILIVIAFLVRGKRKRARKADDDTLTGGKDGFIDLAKHRDTNEA